MSSLSTSRRSAKIKGTGTDPQQGQIQSQTGEMSTSTRTVACPICEASYAPSPAREDLLDAPLEVLEAAFMSLCHYCFRCRRAACPQCWDAVHKVCGACVLEAQLPFRSESSPLQGTLFPPPASQVGHREAIDSVGISENDAIAPLLICVRSGRFQEEMASLPSHTAPRLGPRVPARGTRTMDERVSPVGLASMVRVPLVGTLGGGWGGTAEFFHGLERILNVVLGILLLFVIVLIVVAELSATANAQLLWLFHVDIRSEIAYILYVIQQLRW